MTSDSNSITNNVTDSVTNGITNETVLYSPTTWIGPVLLALGSLVSVLVATSRFGPGMTPDSVQYLAAAESLSSGDGLLTIGGAPFAWWAPGLPVLLSILSRFFGSDPVQAARILNAVLAFLSCLAGWVILRRVHGAGWRSLFGLAVFALGMGHLVVSTKLLSEPMFGLLVLLMVITLARADSRSHDSRRDVLVAAVVAALAFLFRYAGVAVIGAGVVFLLASGRDRKRALLRAFVFGAIATTPGLLWLIRNRIVAGSFTGQRPVSVGHDSLIESIAGLPDLFAPPVFSMLVSVVGGCLLFALSALAIDAATRDDGKWTSRTNRAGHGIEARNANRAGPITVRLCAILVLTYLIFLFVTVWLGLSSVPDARLLYPILLPVIVILVTLLPRRGASTSGEVISEGSTGEAEHAGVGASGFAGTAAFGAAGYLTTLLFTGAICVGLVFVVMRHDLGGGGLNTAAWRSSPTVASLRDLPTAGSIWSNKPEAIRFFRGVRSGNLADLDMDRAPQSDGRSDRQSNGPSIESGNIVVWFAEDQRNQTSYRQWLREAVGLAVGGASLRQDGVRGRDGTAHREDGTFGDGGEDRGSDAADGVCSRARSALPQTGDPTIAQLTTRIPTRIITQTADGCVLIAVPAANE